MIYTQHYNDVKPRASSTAWWRDSAYALNFRSPRQNEPSSAVVLFCSVCYHQQCSYVVVGARIKWSYWVLINSLWREDMASKNVLQDSVFSDFWTMMLYQQACSAVTYRYGAAYECLWTRLKIWHSMMHWSSNSASMDLMLALHSWAPSDPSPAFLLIREIFPCFNYSASYSVSKAENPCAQRLFYFIFIS